MLDIFKGLKLMKKIPINIPRDLYEEIKFRVKASEGEFRSVEEYVTFILREIVKEKEPRRVYTPEEEKAIKERLRNLGYL